MGEKVGIKSTAICGKSYSGIFCEAWSSSQQSEGQLVAGDRKSSNRIMPIRTGWEGAEL